MVLYDPMERPLLQLVTSHPATDKKLFPRRAPAWAGDISRLSDAQLRSVHAFTQFAINNLRGVTGTSSLNGNEVSNTAIEVAENYPNTGNGAFGGMSAEERRQANYASAERTEELLRQELSQRGVSTGSSRVSNNPMTDGGTVQED